MSQTILHDEFRVDGVLTDMTSVVLRDPATLLNPLGTFGVRRTDTLAVVVAAGTAMTRTSLGVYEYTLTDPAAGLTYNYWVEFVYLGETYRFERNRSADAVLDTGAAAAMYCTLAEGRAIATMLGLAKFNAAADDKATAALIQASIDIDFAMRYQGRRYDLGQGGGTSVAQVREFPRVAYESPVPVAGFGGFGAGFGVGLGIGSTIWDWDQATKAAVVPVNVKRAAVYQADSICSGKLAKALDDLFLGVASKSVGSLSISYRDPAAVLAAIGGVFGGAGALCRQAAMIMSFYRIRQGRIL